MKNVTEVLNRAKKAIEEDKARGAWAKGVNAYALELVETLEEFAPDWETLTDRKAIEETMLNGASDWWAYSRGGWSLIYNGEIAERLCNPTELKRTNHGQKDPNKRESWVDTQGRALFQAAHKVLALVHDCAICVHFGK